MWVCGLHGSQHCGSPKPPFQQGHRCPRIPVLVLKLILPAPHPQTPQRARNASPERVATIYTYHGRRGGREVEETQFCSFYACLLHATWFSDLPGPLHSRSTIYSCPCWGETVVCSRLERYGKKGIFWDISRHPPPFWCSRELLRNAGKRRKNYRTKFQVVVRRMFNTYTAVVECNSKAVAFWLVPCSQLNFGSGAF